MKKPKRHYLRSHLSYLLLAFLIIPIIYVVFFATFQTMIFTLIAILPLLFIPALLRSYVVIVDEAIQKYSEENKYSLDGKPIKKGPSYTIKIRHITKIERRIKDKQITGLVIFVEHHSEPTKINSKTASNLLKEILAVNTDIEVI